MMCKHLFFYARFLLVKKMVSLFLAASDVIEKAASNFGRLELVACGRNLLEKLLVLLLFGVHCDE